jgi:hypothetical protein
VRPRIDLRADAGYTLVELLAALVIGMIVLFGALTMLDNTAVLSSRVTKRVDALQRGRNAMDLVVRDLRSQVCVGLLVNATTGATDTDPSLRAGSDTSVDFYTDLGDGSAAKPPTRRVLTFNSTAHTITETIYTKPTGNRGAYVFPSTVDTTRTLLTDVYQDGSTPVFRYYGYDTSTPPAPNALFPAASGLSDTNLGNTVRIAIAFKTVRTAGGSASNDSATFADSVLLRSVDPDDETPTSTCVS